jgi:lipopolysaccharide export system protein LptA
MSKYLSKKWLKLSETLVILALSTSCYSGHAFAEAADRDKPIDLEADSVKVDDAKHISTYFGNVILTKGTITIHADKLIVREDQEGFQHSSSFGNPTTFKQKREGKNEYIEGSSQRIEYDARMDKVQLYTKAWVKRGEDIVHGDYIMYDANAEFAEVIGGGPKSATAGVPSGRVRAIIQPKNKQPTDSGSDNTKTNNNAKPIPATPPNNNGAALKDSRFSQNSTVSGENK